ncbi:2-hydroxy-3-oxopropionate reductase [soil metagenome]
MAEKLGFIGLGIMGQPMAKNLLDAGYELIVHNRSREVVDRLTSEHFGVTAASSPREVGAAVSIVITMLPDSPDVTNVVFGVDGDGLIESMGDGDLLIDMSTIAPATAIEVNKALVERGASALDAPVSGGDQGAIAGTLSIMVGGTEADFDRAAPIFEVLGGTVTHCGDAGAGQTVKACNQIAVAVNYAAASEALVLGAKAGVDPEKIIQVLNGGLAASRVMEMRGPTMIEGKFDPGFRIDLHRKDLGIIMDSGKEFGVPLPVTSLVSQLYDALSANGKGDLDHSALITAIETMANFRVADR